MDALIGYSGFVGSNLALQHKFDIQFNSKNIDEITSNDYDLVVCAGASGLKWYADRFPENDLNGIRKLVGKLKEIKTKRFVLISTIDVYKIPEMVDEETTIEKDGLKPYGMNRLYLENWVTDTFQEYNIVRLPSLFGKGIKKNFIYDLITLVPSVISTSHMELIKTRIGKDELNVVLNSYKADEKGYYFLSDEIENTKFERLKSILKNIDCTSLILTDERSSFQFYYLKHLWDQIQTIIENDIKLVNLAVEPIDANELARDCFSHDFINIISGKEPVRYDVRTRYSELFGRRGDYIYNKVEIINQIKEFLTEDGIEQ